MPTDKHRRARARAARLIAAGALVLTGANIASQGVATAVHDEEFQLEVPNADVDDDPGVAAEFDWESFFNAAGQPSPALPNALLRPNFVASGFRADGALPDGTTFTQGSKDTLSIANDWVCTQANNVGDKVDILNAYAVAYIRPGDNHLILYYGVEKASPLGTSNIGVWFLKDGTVDCSSSGGAVEFTGGHVEGDILLVSEFSNGGVVATVRAYEWVGDDATGHLNTEPIASGQICGTGSDDACSTVNRGNFVDPPWASVDKNGGDLDPLEFFEGGIDVGVAGTDTCFATFLANTRTSTSLTSDKPDYARGSFPVCGGLTVKKYIDVDMSGTNNAGDVTSGDAVTAWSFTVNGPAANGGIGPVRCTGTTNATGQLVCTTGTLANLTPGTYRITETQKAGFFNTDPGPAPNTAAFPFEDFTVGPSGGTAELGNTCFVDKTFTITGVPATGVSSITARYTVASGPNTGATADVALADQGGGSWSGTVNDTFVQTNTIDWVWFINGDASSTNVGGTGESLAGGAYPVCADTNTDTFPRSTLTGFKYKDVNNDGDFNAGDLNGAGFTFSLLSGATVLQTAVSDANGAYSFSNVAPGTYTVAEQDETGWNQTEPLGNTANRTVTVPFNQANVTIGDFGNHPLSTVSASFTAQAKSPPGSATPATQATITCAGTQNASVADLPVGIYTCTIVITDP